MSLVKTEVVGFAEYHKIETLFERDPSTFVVDPSKLKASVLSTIREWDVTEKIDGTNIRVARPIETLFDKKMSRVIIKLKTKDFVAGKR